MSRANQQPDVLIILSDQQRPDTIGAYGQTLPVTPVLDQLAGRGTIFDQTFTVGPVCGPARASIQTGRYPTEIGCWRNGLALPSGVQTLATRVADLGYATGYVGKWHLASNRGPVLPAGRDSARNESNSVPRERRGGYNNVWVAADALEMTSGPYHGHMWDEHGSRVELSGYRVDAIGDIAIDRLHRLMQRDQPFLLFVSFLEPHHQNNRLRTIGPKGQAHRFAGFDVPGDLRGTLGDWRWNYASSLAACEAIDRNVGRMLDAMEETGRRDNTLVIYSSDHGSHYRTRNPEYKRSCHDASIRVPLIINGPGFREGYRDERLVSHLDILPTVVVAAGGTDPCLAGRALQVSMRSTESTSATGHHLPSQPYTASVAGSDWRDEILVQISESQIGRALRTATHTFSAAAPGVNPWRGHFRSASSLYMETHLYDLRVDPFQRDNLAGSVDHRGVREELADRLASAIYRIEGQMPDVELICGR